MDAVDTTAAGDAFSAALGVALARQIDFREALDFAAVAAGLACTKRGARPSLPSFADVSERLRWTA